MGAKPLLFLDIDGVISLYGFAPNAAPIGQFEAVDGIAHFISGTAGEHLHELGQIFELVWCSGWEEKANEHLPRLLALPGPLAFLSFSGPAVATSPAASPATAGGASWGHWKVEAIERHAGGRPLAWVDDALNEGCHRWAADRGAPTLLVATDPAAGLGAGHVRRLRAWAQNLPSKAHPPAGVARAGRES